MNFIFDTQRKVFVLKEQTSTDLANIKTNLDTRDKPSSEDIFQQAQPTGIKKFLLNISNKFNSINPLSKPQQNKQFDLGYANVQLLKIEDAFRDDTVAGRYYLPIINDIDNKVNSINLSNFEINSLFKTYANSKFLYVLSFNTKMWALKNPSFTIDEFKEKIYEPKHQETANQINTEKTNIESLLSDPKKKNELDTLIQQMKDSIVSYVNSTRQILINTAEYIKNSQTRDAEEETERISQAEKDKKNNGFSIDKFNEYANQVFEQSKERGILKNMSQREFNQIVQFITPVLNLIKDNRFINSTSDVKLQAIEPFLERFVQDAHLTRDKIKIASSILLKNIFKLFLGNIENENKLKDSKLDPQQKINNMPFFTSLFDKLETTSDDVKFAKDLESTNITESKVLKEYREEISTLLIPTMQKELKFDRLPTLNFIEDEENAKDMFGRTAHYNPNTSEITVYITGRHPKDIMRSVAHEVIHHAQNCRGEFDNAFNLGEEGYAQSNNHLRKMEKEAYLLGNMLFRDWEDNLKRQRNTTAMINEKALRAKIRQLIAEEVETQSIDKAENEPAHKYDKNCPCKTCKETKQRRTATNLEEATKRVVQEDKQQMPLNEWRRLELNSLLLNRFGIVSPEVLGEKKSQEKGGVPKTARQKQLAAKTPPHDKITRGDVIKAATEGEDTKKSGDEKEEKKGTKPKKGQIPPQLKAHVKGKKS